MPPKARPKKSLSGIKRIRQAKKRNLRNRTVSSRVKTIKKKLLSAIDSGGKEAVSGTLKEAIKVISSAASKGVMHKNTASRDISRLSKRVNKIPVKP